MQTNNLHSTYTKVVYYLLLVALISPLVFSNSAIYGTVVHRFLFFWFFIDLALLVFFFDKIYKTNKVKLSLIQIIFVANLGLVLISNLFGVAYFNSLFSSFERMMGFISLLHFTLYFLIGSSYNFTDKQWNTFAIVFLLVGVIAGIIGLFTYKTEHDMRLTAKQANPMHSSGYMLGLIFIILATFGKKWDGITKKEIGIILIKLFSITFFTYILFLTLTRASIIALTIGGVVFLMLLLWQVRSLRKYILLGIVASSFIIGLLYLNRNHHLVTSNRILSKIMDLSLESESIKARLDLWKMVIKHLDDKLLLGWGQENFIYFYAKHYTPNLYNAGSWYDSAHNVFLDKIVSTGFVGLLLFLSILISLFYLIWNKYSKLNSVEKSAFTAYLVAYLVYLFFGFDGFTPSLIFYSIAIYIYQQSGQKKSWELLIPSKLKIPLMLLVTIAIIYAISILVFKTLQTNRSITKAHMSRNLAEIVSLYNEASEKALIGEYDVALQFASKSVSIMNSANLTQEDKNYYKTNVKKVVDKALAHYPDNPMLLTQYGFALWSGGEVKEAIEVYKTLVQLSPQKQESLVILGNLYLKQNNTDEAFKYFDKAYKLDTSNHKPLFYLSYCKAITKDIEISDNYLKKLSAQDIKENMDLVYTIYAINNRYSEYFDYMVKLYKKVFSYEDYVYLTEKAIQQNNGNAARGFIVGFINHFNIKIKTYDDAVETVIKSSQSLSIKEIFEKAYRTGVI